MKRPAPFFPSPFAAFALLFAACGDVPSPMAMTPPPGPDVPPLLATGPIKLERVEWNLKSVDVGKVAGVAELGADLAVYGDQGMEVFFNGQIFASDPSDKAWRSAAVIPAADQAGQWIVGVDGGGHVRRLRNQSTMEDISDRYGLESGAVHEIAVLDDHTVAFSLDAGIAVADGKTVTRYGGRYVGLVGGRGRVGGLDGQAVRLFDPAHGRTLLFMVPEVVGAAFEPGGKLVVATRRSLYLESGDHLKEIHRFSDVSIHGLAATGTGVWLAIGDTLGFLSGKTLKLGPSGLGLIAAEARLASAANGDAWVIGPKGLSRYGEYDTGGMDERQWKETVLPVYTRTCSLCHLPGGSAGVDLSTYAAWSMRRALVHQRVIDRKPSPMPPAGAGILTPDELAAIKVWTESM